MANALLAIVRAVKYTPFQLGNHPNALLLILGSEIRIAFRLAI